MQPLVKLLCAKFRLVKLGENILKLFKAVCSYVTDHANNYMEIQDGVAREAGMELS